MKKSAAMASAVIATLGMSTFAFGQATTQPVVKDDAILALSVSNAYQSVKHVKADLSVKNSGTVTGTSWANAGFIQSVEFDNLNGFRHNANGNLLALDFGTTAGGGRLINLSTQITAGQTTPAASTQLFAFNGQNGTELGRIGGLAVAPNNAHVSITGNEFRAAGAATSTGVGKLVVLDYAAGDGSGTNGAVTNYRSIEVPGLRTGTASRTSSTAWLDSNNVLVAAGSPDNSTQGNLVKVTVGSDGSLSQTTVASDLFQGFNMTFTNVTYEPTVSPYVFVSGSGFISNSTVNKLIVVDPNNDFQPVTGLLDFSPSGSAGTPDGQVNTLRETAFDSKGNLLIGAFAGSTALSDEYILKSLINAKDVANLSSGGSNLVGILQKQQTSDATTTTAGGVVINGTSSSFNGNDVAITNIDLVNADVVVNIGSGDYTQQYFGTSPKALLLAKLKNGKLTGAPGTGHAVGYSLTADASGGTFRVKETLNGDATLDGTVAFADLVALAQNYNQLTGRVWAQGDFNYDEAVNFADLVLLAQNYNKTYSAAQLAAAGFSANFIADFALAQSLVPEPTSLAAFGAVALLAARRRSR